MTDTLTPDFLDQSHEMIRAGRVVAGMADLTADLRRARDQWSQDEWISFCRDVCPRHPLQPLVQQDPFTNHSFRRPRGYPELIKTTSPIRQAMLSLWKP